GLAVALWRTLPPRHATAAIPGLGAPVTVAFGPHGIPRIRAATLTDAMAALGYIHARERMFQMQLMRRAAAGRLSALVGPATLPLDEEMRTLGLAAAARAQYAALPPRARAWLVAYAAGVNAFIAAHGRFSAPEDLWFGPPRPWRPWQSLLWAETMGLWLSGNWRTELARFALAHHPGAPVDPRALWPAQHETGKPALPSFPAPFTEPAHESNEWAVSGAHSVTGHPLLAGDPHLGFGFPSLWYLARIDTPHATLVGATAPGVPGVILGRNRHIAWTFTSTGADVQDVYEETPVGHDRYATPAGPKRFGIRIAPIAVRGQAPVRLVIRTTRHGPVINPLLGLRRPLLAVEMANLAPGDTAAAGLFALDRADSVAAAAAAAARITAPVQNLLVAGRTNIGMFTTGRVPIRAHGDGAAPVPGASGRYDWVGWASGAALPHGVDPPSGMLVNANNRTSPRHGPVFLGRDAYAPWRARRIRALLARRRQVGLRYFLHMQTDRVSLFARALLGPLSALPPPPGLAGRALRLLRGWNGAMRMSLPQPLIFHAWMGRFYALVMARNHIPPDDAAFAAPFTEFLPSLFTPAGAHWCGGDCTPLLTRALIQSTAALAARFGPDPRAWRWGVAHQAVFAHPVLGRLPWLGRLFTWRIAAPGSATTIDAAGTAPGRFTAVHGPEFRAVYDLADLGRSRFIVAPGQSGNPLSGHAADLLHRWRDGRSLVIGPVPRRIAATLRLVPAP
ncbi:MAG: penicillin acylase family protein, partial [Acetobacteraceae bacterium]